MEKEKQQLTTNIPDLMDLGDLQELMRCSSYFIHKLRKKKILPIVMLGYGKYFITKGMLLGTIDSMARELQKETGSDTQGHTLSETTKIEGIGDGNNE